MSGLHKFNEEGKKTVIKALRKNEWLRTLDLKNTTEEFYYNLRDKLEENEIKI